jgi:hypothetical protein
MTNKRFCFVSDNDSHSYIIPLEMRQEFSDLLEDSEKQDDYDLFNIRFDKYRCNMHPNWYSFTDPKEIDK